MAQTCFAILMYYREYQLLSHPCLMTSTQFLLNLPSPDPASKAATNPEVIPASLDPPQHPSVGTQTLQKMFPPPSFQEWHPMVPLQCTSSTHQVNTFDFVQLQSSLW